MRTRLFSNQRLARLLTAAVLLAGAVAVPAPSAHALTVLAVDFDTLIAGSELVLHGDVTATQVLDRRREGRGIWTEIRLQVRDVWKGDARLAGTTFVWRTLGGTTKDGLTMAVPGMPQFTAGERVAVALERTPEGWVVTGGPQGKFQITQEKNGQWLVRRPVTDVHAVRKDGKTGKLEEVRLREVVRTLPQFAADVRAAVRRAK